MAFVCNPYLAVLQKRLYLKYWKDEVDEVLINVNGRNDMIRDWIAKLWSDDDKVTYVDNVPKEIRQGTAFDNLFPHVKGKVLITLDSDNFIYTKGIINKYSNLILEGEYDCAGSFGFHAFANGKGKCDTAGMAIKKFGTVRLNPFLSFWDKNIMDKIENITFKTYNHGEGEKFAPLGVLPQAGWLDIMAKVSLEFFSKGAKILKIPVGMDGAYTHVGAISSQFRAFFRSLEDGNTQKYEEGTVRQQQMYYHGCHNLIYNKTKDAVPFPEYNKEYRMGWEEQMKKLNVKQEEINKVSESLIKRHKNCFI